MSEKWNEKLQAMSAKMEELSKQAQSVAEDAKLYRELGKEAIEEKISTVKGGVAAMQENVRYAEEKRKSKISSSLLKAQMKLRAKLEDKKNARDKKNLEKFIIGDINFILDCYDGAALLLANAQLAILETAEALAIYEERFGAAAEPETTEEEVAEELSEETEEEKAEE